MRVSSLAWPVCALLSLYACLPDLELGPEGSAGPGAAAATSGSGGSSQSSGGANVSSASVGGSGGNPTSSSASAGGGTDCGPLCTCMAAEVCNFTCDTPPCDVNCEGGSSCTGECGAANCNCQGGSSCTFTCVQPNCNMVCTQNSQCILDCVSLTPQTAACDISPCQGGNTMLCPDGHTLVCNAACP